MGARGLAVIVGSGTLGGAYFAYLVAEPFPPDVIRIVPLAWLAGSVWGWMLLERGLRLGTHRVPTVVGVILNVPNTLFAASFSLAALIGG